MATKRMDMMPNLEGSHNLVCGSVEDSDDVASTHDSKQVAAIVEAAQVALFHHELCDQLQIGPASHSYVNQQFRCEQGSCSKCAQPPA